MALKDILMFIMCVVVSIDGRRKNVLFLVADDMRPQLGAYLGPDFPSPTHPKPVSPNLDALAKRSLLLKRAYVQQALCNPSRSSLLTGRRPDTTHVYDLVHYFRKVGGNFTTIPQYFKENGYMTVGMGKIFHPGEKASGNDDPISWSVPYYHATHKGDYNSKDHSWRAVPREEYEKHPLPDDQLADHAQQVLRGVAPAALSGQQPFFVAVGFHKPHLPFVFREEFMDLYPMDEIRLPDNAYAPVNMPDVAWFKFDNLRSFKDLSIFNATGDINTTFPDNVVRDLRRAYYSALSYTDSLVGEVLGELDALGLRNNTIVSFWGDHGWELGEHGEWCKQTNFENAVHAPMMISIPGSTDAGVVTEQLTEFVDLFPTLVEAAQLAPIQPCPINSTNVLTCSQGRSLIPLINNPDVPIKSVVFSQYPRKVDNHRVMGYTLRTQGYRYTEWAWFNDDPVYRPDWTKLFGVELYNHTSDPEENYNHAYDETYMTLRNHLSSLLHENGYMTVGMGKIFHPGEEASGNDDPISWSVPYYHAKDTGDYYSKDRSWRAVPQQEYEKNPLPDDLLADHAQQVLRGVAPAALSGQQPFFVAVGFHKPHLPFVFREEFMDLYPMDEIRLPDNAYAPVNMPDVAWYKFSYLRSFKDISLLNATGDINTTFPDNVVRDLRRAYYSALSYTDSLVGKVLGELDALGLRNSTIVSFWGDHGWELGEHGEWCKHSNFENAVHAPMMISIPGSTDAGVVTEQLTEFVDLFPTLVEAAQLAPLPPCPINSTNVPTCSQGRSLIPLINNPDVPIKSVVFSQYPRQADNHRVMGYTLRTQEYRYTEWAWFNDDPVYRPDWTKLFGVELYNHTSDPEENYNHAYDETYMTLRNHLSSLLHGYSH